VEEFNGGGDGVPRTSLTAKERIGRTDDVVGVGSGEQ